MYAIIRNTNLFVILFSTHFSFVYSQIQHSDRSTGTTTTKVFKFDIKEEIAPPILRTTKLAFKQAEEIKANLIIIEMDTYGGHVDAADEIRTIILDSKIPVWVFIQNNAASAGSFISIACDSIYMKPGATIGASTVVDQNGDKVGEKYQSFMRSRMRSTAEQNGRNADIAEAMVEWTKPIPGFKDSGKVVSMTVNEAIQYDFCDGQYNSIDELLKGEGVTNYELIEYKETTISAVIKFFLRPGISGLLISIIILSIFAEIKTPGLGISSVIAFIAAALYFIPHYLDGLAAYWEMALFLVGLILILLEIFYFPGFGVAGISGATCVFISLVFAMVKSVPSPNLIDLPNVDDLLRALLIVILSTLAPFGLILIFGRKMLSSGMFKKVAMEKVELKAEGYESHHLAHNLVGQTGIVTGILKPIGNIRIGDEIYEAKTHFGTIDKGESVTVVAFDNFTLIVEKI